MYTYVYTIHTHNYMTNIYASTCTYIHILVLKETPTDKVVLRHLERVLRLRVAAQLQHSMCHCNVTRCSCIVLRIASALCCSCSTITIATHFAIAVCSACNTINLHIAIALCNISTSQNIVSFIGLFCKRDV